MDISIYETFDGGDVVRKTNDLQITNSLYNTIYLSLFGGNIEPEEEGINTEWWGNYLIQDDNQKFISQTEKTLQNVALTSAGIRELETAIKEDLNHLKDAGQLTVTVTVDGSNKVKILVNIQQEKGNEEYEFLWAKTNEETITEL